MIRVLDVLRGMATATLGALLGAALLVIAYAWGPDLLVSLDIDPPPIVHGLYPVERAPDGLTFAWSRDQLRVMLPGLDRQHPWQFKIRFSTPRPPRPGRRATRRHIRGRWRRAEDRSRHAGAIPGRGDHAADRDRREAGRGDHRAGLGYVRARAGRHASARHDGRRAADRASGARRADHPAPGHRRRGRRRRHLRRPVRPDRPHRRQRDARRHRAGHRPGRGRRPRRGAVHALHPGHSGDRRLRRAGDGGAGVDRRTRAQSAAAQHGALRRGVFERGAVPETARAAAPAHADRRRAVPGASLRMGPRRTLVLHLDRAGRLSVPVRDRPLRRGAAVRRVRQGHVRVHGAAAGPRRGGGHGGGRAALSGDRRIALRPRRFRGTSARHRRTGPRAGHPPRRRGGSRPLSPAAAELPGPDRRQSDQRLRTVALRDQPRADRPHPAAEDTRCGAGCRGRGCCLRRRPR